LESEGVEVLCTDPYVHDASLVDLHEAISRADIIILGAPHSLYRDLQFAANKRIVDVWNFWPARVSARLREQTVATSH
jgi:UDP-N-acetyl-D-mannosaminuronic acid dehydrogenase